MFDLVFFWKPWSWKWTQAELLQRTHSDKLTHLSTGDVFRSITSKKNAIGDYVIDRMNSWFLIEDNITISLFNAYFYTLLSSNKKMLLDGYPRTIFQMHEFVSFSQKHKRKVIGLNFEITDDICMERMHSRSRQWEDNEVIKTRLQEYYSYTYPLTEIFAKHFLIYTIDATLNIEEVHNQVVKIAWL